MIFWLHPISALYLPSSYLFVFLRLTSLGFVGPAQPNPKLVIRMTMVQADLANLAMSRSSSRGFSCFIAAMNNCLTLREQVRHQLAHKPSYDVECTRFSILSQPVALAQVPTCDRERQEHQIMSVRYVISEYLRLESVGWANYSCDFISLQNKIRFEVLQSLINILSIANQNILYRWSFIILKQDFICDVVLLFRVVNC